MAKREPLMSELYFENQVKTANDEIQFYDQLALNPTPKTKLDLVYFNNYIQRRNRLIASYSVGVPIETLMPLYSAWVEALTLYKQQPEAQKILFVKDADEYLDALMLISLALLLKVPQSLFNRVISLLDSENTSDGLLDILIARRQPDRSINAKLAFPKLYTPLYEAARQQPVAPERIRSFLNTWYKTCLKATATYELHTLHGGIDSGFNGYWAWEVAAVTYCFAVDDSTYQGMSYYPADLVRYSRGESA